MTLRILHDEQYTGTYTAGKNKTIKVGNPNRAKTSKEGWIRIPNHHPAIISQELFDAVQAQLPTKGDPLRRCKTGTAQRYASPSSLLKGKVICGGGERASSGEDCFEHRTT